SNATGQPGWGLGAESDGDDFLDPNMANGAGNTITRTTAPYYTPSGNVCANDFLPSVAAWMFATNLASAPGTNLRLYTVGVGSNYFGELEPLKAAAAAGHGMYLAASNFAQLENNIKKVFLDIISNATSFSVAAITTVQTRGTTFAFIPRFRPLGGSQWEGRLLRFKLFNEFAAGCDVNVDKNVKDAVNPNGNASCTDLYLQDKNNKYIAESSASATTGNSFFQLDVSQPWNPATVTGWPFATGAGGAKVPATPVWEAETELE